MPPSTSAGSGEPLDAALLAKLGRALAEGRPKWAAPIHDRLVVEIATRVTQVRSERAKGPLPPGALWRVACVEAIERLRGARDRHPDAPRASGDPIDPLQVWRALRDQETDKHLERARRRDPAFAEEYALAVAFAEGAERDEAVTGVEMSAAEFYGADDEEDEEDAPAPAPAKRSGGLVWIIVAVVAVAAVVGFVLTRG